MKNVSNFGGAGGGTLQLGMVFPLQIHQDTFMTQGSNVDTSTRLRIATRIHFALLRRYGEAVEIDSLLKGDDESREALWVCEASGDAELGTLAKQFVAAGEPARKPRRPAAPAPQDAAWAQNTSGFGVSRPQDLEPARPRRRTPSMLNPLNWLRREGH